MASENSDKDVRDFVINNPLTRFAKETVLYCFGKCKETVGLQLTPVQRVYWRAVQRRMVLAQLEELIEDNIAQFRKQDIKVPYELVSMLIKHDPAIEKYLVAFLSKRDIDITLPRDFPQPQDHELEEVDGVGKGQGATQLIQADGYPIPPANVEFTDDAGFTEDAGLGTYIPPPKPSSPTPSPTYWQTYIRPTALTRYMKQKDETLENEEEILEEKGGFLQQGWLALSYLGKQLKEKRSVVPDTKPVDEDRSSSEEVDSPLSEDLQYPYNGMGDVEDSSSDDDYNDLLIDRIYDREQITSTDGYVPYRELSDHVDAEFRRAVHRVGGKSLRPAWTAITEYIPFLISNFRFKHIVKTVKNPDNMNEYDLAEEKMRNKQISSERHAKLKKLWIKSARWPLFTYWLMFVQTLILIITASVYGFAPYGYLPSSEVALVRQSSLSIDIVEKQIIPNMWLGPPQSALVLLGANYGPCMRRDRLLFDVIEQDHQSEASQSGCCVRRDGSGCVQVPGDSGCPTKERLADFVFYDFSVDSSLYSNRSVCGTSPRTCVSPPSSSTVWQVSSISDWPICKEADTSSVNNSHLTCEVTGRPCCIGIQAECLITTRENCDFLEGKYHDDAFLCSQVDCLKSICGLTPFTSGNPDQLQRLGLAMFLHAGIFHLMLTLLFDFIILRNLEKYLGWLSTTILFMGSGIGGNVISSIFVPYSPEVGPAASIFGVISFFLVFIIFHWRMLYRPWVDILKYLVVVVILIVIGLFPYVDNFARLGGMLFGVLFSFVHVHHIPDWEGTQEFKKFKYFIVGDSIDNEPFCSKDKGLAPKVVLLIIGLVFLIVLYVLSFALFLDYQSTWDGFTYINCIIPTSVSDLCLDFTQEVRPRLYR